MEPSSPSPTAGEREMALYRSLVETMPMVAWEFDLERDQFTFVSGQIVGLFGRPPSDFVGNRILLDQVHPDDAERMRRAILDAVAPGSAGTELEYRFFDGEGTLRVGRAVVRRAEGTSAEGTRVFGLSTDVTARRKKEMEVNQSHKLEAVGQLAAGIAHEINTPIQFVSDSLYFVRDAVHDGETLLAAYHDFVRAAASGTATPEQARAILAIEESTDISYVRENLPGAIDRALDGLGRVSHIVRAMKEFAHPDQTEMTPSDLTQLLYSVLTIARNEYKYVADVTVDFQPVPPVVCHPGEVSQALLNLVVNAAHAVADRVAGTRDRGHITVRSSADGDTVTITVEDTGGGIPESIRHRVFEPFFTTKEVGRGTGQGLAIARNAIVDKHGGEISFESKDGVGTTFLVRLPIAGRARTDAQP